MWKLVLAFLSIVAIALLAMVWSQDDVIFPTRMVPGAGRLPAGAERMTVETADRQRLVGVHIPPRGGPKGERTLILGFGGNAWNAQHVAEYLRGLYPDAHVVTFHYRGYAPSAGSPSADALLADAPLVFDAAVDSVKPERAIVVGFSIGSGIAASLAGRRDVGGLILVTPFDSLKAVASSLYPWLPVGPFFRHEIDTVAGLRGSKVPVAILAGEKDEIIPGARTDALRRQVPNLVFDRTIRGVGHNDIYHRPEFQRAMVEALAALD